MTLMAMTIGTNAAPLAMTLTDRNIREECMYPQERLQAVHRLLRASEVAVMMRLKVEELIDELWE